MLRSAIDGARQAGVSREAVDGAEARLQQVGNAFAAPTPKHAPCTALVCPLRTIAYPFFLPPSLPSYSRPTHSFSFFAGKRRSPCCRHRSGRCTRPSAVQSRPRLSSSCNRGCAGVGSVYRIDRICRRARRGGARGEKCGGSPANCHWWAAETVARLDVYARRARGCTDYRGADRIGHRGRGTLPSGVCVCAYVRGSVSRVWVCVCRACVRACIWRACVRVCVCVCA